MPVQIATSATGRVAVVALVGEHDLVTAESLRQSLVELSSRVALVVLDFEQASFIDSTVIGVLVAAWKRAASHGNQVIGVNGHGTVAKALHLTGVDGLLRMVGDDLPQRPEAIENELASILRKDRSS